MAETKILMKNNIRRHNSIIYILLTIACFMLAAGCAAATSGDGDASAAKPPYKKPYNTPEVSLKDTFKAPSPLPPAKPDFSKRYYPGGSIDEKCLALIKSGALDKFIPETHKVLGAASGDLTGSGFVDVVMVTRDASQDEDEDENEENYYPRYVEEENEVRLIFILLGDKDGNFRFLGQNDNLILANGGVWGNPFNKITVNGDNSFTVEHYGGSSSRWLIKTTFKYSKKENDFFLLTNEEMHYSTHYPGYSEATVLETADNFGCVKFTDYVHDFNTRRDYLSKETTVFNYGEIKIEASYPFIQFAAKEKEKKLRAIITEDFNRCVEVLKTYEKIKNAKISCYRKIQNPDIISLEYWVSVNTEKHSHWFQFAVNIDAKTLKRINLLDLYSAQELADGIMKQLKTVNREEKIIIDKQSVTPTAENLAKILEDLDSPESLGQDFSLYAHFNDKVIVIRQNQGGKFYIPFEYLPRKPFP